MAGWHHRLDGHSGSCWWTGRPGVLWFMGSQRVRHDWATELTDWLTHTLSISVLVMICYYFIFLFTCLSSPSSFSIRLAALWRRSFMKLYYIPVPGIQKVLPKQISMLILVKWKNQHSRWEFPGGSVVRTLAPLQGTGVPSLVREPRSHNLWGAAKKKVKTTTTKKHSQGIMRCLLSQEKRCTVNVSKNSNETWCLSIPLPCKVLNAGISFSFLVVTTTDPLPQATQHHLSSILCGGGGLVAKSCPTLAIPWTEDPGRLQSMG